MSRSGGAQTGREATAQRPVRGAVRRPRTRRTRGAKIRRSWKNEAKRSAPSRRVKKQEGVSVRKALPVFERARGGSAERRGAFLFCAFLRVIFFYLFPPREPLILLFDTNTVPPSVSFRCGQRRARGVGAGIKGKRT